MDYVPLAGLDGYTNPHDEQPTRRDPWFVWAIAASPLMPLVVILLLGSASGWAPILIALAAVIATSVACMRLAWHDQRAIADLGSRRSTDPRLALLPGVYVLLRAVRRVTGPHRGNPLHPVVLNFFAGFALAYYFVLVLMGIASIVNRG